MIFEQVHVGVTVRHIYCYLFDRLLNVASMQSPSCLITSLLSATQNLPLIFGNWYGIKKATLQGKQQPEINKPPLQPSELLIKVYYFHLLTLPRITTRELFTTIACSLKTYICPILLIHQQ